MGRKTCAAHTDNTRFADQIPDVVLRHISDGLYRHRHGFLIQAVIIDDNGIHTITRHDQPLFDRFHRAGYRSIDRNRYKSGCLRDLLSL